MNNKRGYKVNITTEELQRRKDRIMRVNLRRQLNPQNPNLREKFYGRCIKGTKKECWTWAGNLNKGGYGKLAIKNKSILAHRLSWIVHFGRIPAGMCVLHACDNPTCVNPNHLWLGTRTENNMDRDKKNRSKSQKGESNHNAKLTNEDVSFIRQSGASLGKLSKIFGVSRAHVSRIKNKENWKNIGGTL